MEKKKEEIKENKGIFIIGKKDFKYIDEAYQTGLALHLFDALNIEYILYHPSNPLQEEYLKKVNTYFDESILKEALDGYLIINKILSIEGSSKVDKAGFLASKEELIISILSIRGLQKKVNVLEGLIIFYSEEIKKGKEHQRFKLLDLEKLLEQYKPKKNIITKNNLIDGKQINLYERFLIANEVLQIDNKISTLKISEAEKHNLLSLILGCNIDNAKKILNNTYDAKVKDNLLKSYYKTLKK